MAGGDKGCRDDLSRHLPEWPDQLHRTALHRSLARQAAVMMLVDAFQLLLAQGASPLIAHPQRQLALVRQNAVGLFDTGATT